MPLTVYRVGAPSSGLAPCSMLRELLVERRRRLREERARHLSCNQSSCSAGASAHAMNWRKVLKLRAGIEVRSRSVPVSTYPRLSDSRFAASSLAPAATSKPAASIHGVRDIRLELRLLRLLQLGERGWERRPAGPAQRLKQLAASGFAGLTPDSAPDRVPAPCRSRLS